MTDHHSESRGVETTIISVDICVVSSHHEVVTVLEVFRLVGPSGSIVYSDDINICDQDSERSIFIRKVYLHKFFKDIRQQLGHEVDGRAIELEMDVDSTVVARIDEGRLARAIHNLARNAV